MKFITEAKLVCGHDIVFGMCGAAGHPGQMTHQKDPPIEEAYVDFFAKDSIPIPSRMLEIGVARGGSLAIWRELFPSCEIVGVDRDLEQLQPWTLDHFRENNHIQIHQMVMPDSAITQLGMFDLIIDDGEHGITSVLSAFELCWPMLNAGGTYIVEDWIQNNESKMIYHFMEKLIATFRCWPDATPMPNKPFSINTYRTFFAIRKTS
jgi:precorrin-6B methylase 2